MGLGMVVTAEEAAGLGGARLAVDGAPAGIPKDEGVVEAELGGIWVVVEGHNGIGIVIKEVMPDGPAAKAGLQPGQIITEADGTALADLTMMASLSLLSGPAGTPVRITVMNPKDFNESFVVHLVRKKFPRQPRVARAPNPPLRVEFPRVVEIHEQGRAPYIKVLEETAGLFSRADEGAADKIRQALTKEGIAFTIAEDDMPTVRVAPSASAQAKAVLQKVRAQGHWSVMTLPKDGP
jgi:hypothetical protein